MSDLLDTYTELFVMGDEDGGEFRPHFECSRCDRDVTEQPCPDHAPTGDLPGLRLIECDANPRHYTWIHNRDDYGAPCPWCLLNDHTARDREADACRHWPWRRSWVFRRLARIGYALGVVNGFSYVGGNGHSGCVTDFHWRGKRSYLFGVSRDTWVCWRAGHRRGEPVAFGFCGKCVPWPCCGSERVEHTDGCAEADA